MLKDAAVTDWQAGERETLRQNDWLLLFDVSV